jgi:Fur family iron response transcriptional regulator
MKEMCLTPQQIESALAEKGIQPTAQRIAIGRFVLCESDHPTAEDVKTWADANFPKMSLATVYNTLNSLVHAGLLREYKLPHTDKIIYDNNMKKHYHFFDEDTGKIHDIDVDDIEIKNKLKKKFKIKEIEIIFKGKIV